MSLYEFRCTGCGQLRAETVNPVGTKCQSCGATTVVPASTPVHFARVDYLIGSGNIEDDWLAHFEHAKVHGCDTCGIKPECEINKEQTTQGEIS